MIELGKIQKLKVIRDSQIGLYLASEADEDAILLPNNQVPKESRIGDEIEVFVYRDSEDRMIATRKVPKITVGEIAMLKVVKATDIGAFLDWGLEKDLFLPFKEQTVKAMEGYSYLVGLYVDKSNRLSATMNLYNFLSSDSPYKQNDRVKGVIYNINKELGAFVAVENRYHGLILNKELIGNYSPGNEVEVRVKKVRDDGKLELSLRNEIHNQIEHDAKKIMDRLDSTGGTLMLNDKSDPEHIKAELNMSKAAFKRAVGRLLKEGAIEFTEQGIKRTW